jgi:hypothetical protein
MTAIRPKRRRCVISQTEFPSGPQPNGRRRTPESSAIGSPLTTAPSWTRAGEWEELSEGDTTVEVAPELSSGLGARR